MKKFKKLTAVILLVVICFSLCSCRELNNLRDSHAFFNQNGIIYKDTLYKTVNVSDNLNYNYTNQKNINVTDSGVPVLLSAVIDFNYSMNEDETIIRGGYGEWYVREDKYPLYEDSVKYGINYTDFGFDYFDEELQENTDYIFTKDEKDLFLSLLSSEPTSRNFEVQDMLYLFEQSDDELFRRSDDYIIIRCEDGYYVSTNSDDTDKVYKSNAQTDELFNKFFSKRYSTFNYDYSSN